MPTKKKTTPKPGPVDPAQVHNEQILDDIAKREEQQKVRTKTPMLDALGIRPEKKRPTNAAEFIRDQFDKQNYGSPVMTTRILYGPDPLLISCPTIKLQIEKIGLEDYAQLVYELIVTRQDAAFDDPLLRTGLRQGIKEFGVETIAGEFKKRILSIPSKTVEIETDRGDDDEIFGDPLEDAVRRYGNPGFSPKFMSERCLAAFGKRGYRMVIDEHGDVVKVGTLLMGEIPIHVAERRREHYAHLSDEAVTEQEDVWIDRAAEFMRQAGALAGGSGPLKNKETVDGFALGQAPAATAIRPASESPILEGAEMGLHIEHE